MKIFTLLAFLTCSMFIGSSDTSADVIATDISIVMEDGIAVVADDVIVTTVAMDFSDTYIYGSIETNSAISDNDRTGIGLHVSTTNDILNEANQSTESILHIDPGWLSIGRSNQ